MENILKNIFEIFLHFLRNVLCGVGSPNPPFGTTPLPWIISTDVNNVLFVLSLQAWCKFYEIVYQLKLIPKSARLENKLYTIHLCEAPGAFVASLNHYLKIHHPNMEVRYKFI